MISKQDVLERAHEWNLRPEVVEKDYVLGWVLAATTHLPAIGDHWVLKGGTCVKKCFFETYRFSEDLDFTLLPTAGYTEVQIAESLRTLARRTEEISGIRFHPGHFTVKPRRDKFGRMTFEGRLGYQGPLARSTWPRILFDITQHEPVLTTTVRRGVLHPYPDTLPPDTGIVTYSFEELLAEKTRALYERTRPRDLYDVVYILDNLTKPLDRTLVKRVFEQKCTFKAFTPPTANGIIARVKNAEELRADWNDMLAHQLPYIAPIDGAIQRLGPALAWLTVEEPGALVATSAERPMAPITTSSDQIIAPAQCRGGITELLRFAGSNRLLLSFDYSGKPRLVEPYSLRWAKSTGHLNLYAWEIASGQIKGFTTEKMSNVEIVQQTFTPRFKIELGTPDTISHGVWRP
ncbi:MAG: nucleotidyl transferase AbiEii/AbiGii toxin family protein [Acidobacteriaceae bacterium]|nr:nucleotidyl transferase AbiEii/AbiGii toxin family protein [Acidobacteriaceae bacterium]